MLGSFRGLLARAGGAPARLATAATAADNFTVDPDTAKVLMALSYLLFSLALFAAAAMASATTVLALYTRALPSWLAWTGALATIAGIVTFFIPPASLAVLAWIVAVSAWMLVPRAEPAGAAVMTAHD